MKKIFLLYLVFLFSCQNNSDSRVTNSLSAKDTSLKTITIKDAEASNTLKNFKDKNGQKQGIWDYYERGIVTGFITYKNDTLDGPFKHWITNEEQMYTGNYIKGKREGLFKRCYLYSICELFFVQNFKNDKPQWIGFPHSEGSTYFPVKGFSTESDSVFIECPYENDVIWYTGLVVKKKPVGIHKMYYENGKLKAEADYTLKTINYMT